MSLPLPPTTTSSPSLPNILQSSSTTAEQEQSRSPASTLVPNRSIFAGIASSSPTSTSTPPPSPPLSASEHGHSSKQMVSPRPSTSEHREHSSGETERGQSQFHVAQEMAETTKTTIARSGPLSPNGNDQRDEETHTIADHHDRQYQHHQPFHTSRLAYASQQRQLPVRNEQSSLLGVQPPLPPSGMANLAATAAAAAAAASYTSQELAIAYSMVTSNQQQQQEKQQQRRGQPFEQADHQSSDAFHAHPSGYPAYAPHHSDPTAAAANTQSEHGHDRYPAYHERQQPSQEHRQHRYQSHEHQEPYSDRDLRIPSPLQDQPSRHSQSHHLEHAQPTESSHHLHQHSQSHGHSSAHMYNLSRVDRNHVNGDSSNDSPHHVGQQDKVYDRERERYAYTSEQGPDSGSGSGSGNGNRTNSAGQSDHSTGIRSAPHSLHSYPPGHPSSSSRSAAVSHHPNALNRYPFSIPSISAKLDQPASEDGDDALSSLWKKTTPIQEPYFQTRHTIASQHTLSTLGGVLFSLDEVPLELTQDMYIAMRNRIFELEAKSVNYSPFSNSRKRPIDQSGLDDHRNRHGYDMDSGHHSKRPTYAHPQHPSSRPYGPPEGGRPSSSVHKFTSSYPSWYTPEVYTNGSHYPPHHRGQPSEQDREYRPSEGPYYDRDSRPPSRPSSPPPGHSVTRSVYSPPPAGPSSARLSGPLIQPRPHVAPPQESRPPHHPDDRSPPGPPQNGPYPPSNHSQQQPPHPHHQSNNGLPPSHHSQQPRTSQLPSHPHTQPPSHPHTQPTTHHQPPQLQHPSQIQHQQQPQGHGYTPQSAHQQHHSQHSVQPNGTTTGATTQITSTEIRQSIHQQRHRAQQQAQSAHSRSYHLHKHMRMLDQQRAAQIAAQQVQQQTQQPQQKAQPPKQPLRPIQRHYQPHQQMYPGYNQPVPIKPHPQPPSQQQQPQPQQQTQQQQQQQSQALRPNSFQPQQRMTQQQQMLQRYRQHHQLQQKQQQLRQLQYLRSRQTASYPTQKNSQGVGASSGSHSPTPPPRVFGSQVDRPIRKTTRPLECSNCMALDSLSWKPKSEVQIIALDGSTPSGGESAVAAATAAGGKILCPVCTQYLQTHGKPRPVPPFRTNFLKKIHTRFKRELQEVRFQGWQDAQVLEIEDRMVEREFQMVFNGLDESDVSQIQGRHSSTSGSPAPLASTMSVIAEMATSRDGTSSAVAAKDTETIVIKIEEDDDDEMPLKKAKPDNLEVRTFQSEASVGELFGQRWRTEPVVGYTLVHFGGSDRTRMVPMNPTVPSLTVAFNRSAETITFAFRVLVNGLCLLSSGGGPPALHMPEMADDEEDEEEEEEEEEVVVVPDKDKDDPSPSPPVTASATPSTAEAAGGDPVAATLDDATEKRSITATTSAAVAVTEIYAESVSAAASAEK